MEAELSIPLAINNQLLLFPPVAGPSCQLRQRELGSLSEATSDTMSCAAQRHGRGSAPFFPHLSGRLSGHSATRRRRPDRQNVARRGPHCSRVGRGRDTCRVVRSVFVFSVSQGDVFCGFRFLWICCQEKKKAEGKKNKNGEPGSRLHKINVK